MTTIKLKNGSGAPTAGDLVQGEPALDLTNKRLYTENASGTVIEVGTNPTSITTGDITATGTASFANLATTGDITFGDDDKAIFGAGSDLEIYHTATGNHSIIEEVGGGNLVVRTNGPHIEFDKGSTEYMARMLVDGAVELYYDSALKLATTSTGIDVTGTVTADGLTVDGLAKIQGNATGLVFNETDTTDLNSYLSVNSGNLQIFTANDAFSSFTYRAIISNNTGDIAFYNSAGTSQDLYWDASASSLGIGTTSPGTTLHLSNSDPRITLTDTDAGGNFQIRNTSGVAYISTLGAHPMLFSTNSAEAMRIDSSGNVGIGGSPSFYEGSGLEIERAGIATVRLQNTTSGKSAELKIDADLTLETINTGSNILFNTGATERMRIDSSGDVLVNCTDSIFTTSQSYISLKGRSGDYATLELDGAGSAQGGEVDFGGGGIRQAAIASLTGSDLAFYTNSTNTGVAVTEAMRIDSSGNLLVGKSSVSATTLGSEILANGQINSASAADFLNMYSTSASAYRFYVTNAGSIFATNTSITAISDESLKQNIRDLDKGLDTVLALQPRRFDWKNGDGNDIMGFVAQEVEEVMPELVHDYQYTETETKLGLKMGDMVPTLVKAIQDQQEIIENLKSRIEQLEGAN